jgi:hypothetical protein
MVSTAQMSRYSGGIPQVVRLSPSRLIVIPESFGDSRTEVEWSQGLSCR